MKSFIQKLMDILADNQYTTNYRDIPEEVDNREEIIAEIQAILDDDGLLPDSLRYFVVNGMESASELDAYLQKSFLQFKNEFLAGNHATNDSLKHELLQQLDETKKEIEQAIHESKQLKDEILREMFETKALICDEVKGFILSQQVKSEQELLKKEPQERRSFKWLKDDELLMKFYNKLKLNELISADTDIEDFKAIFTNTPVPEIKKPVQWEKGAKLFAYFFYNLISNNYIPQRPTWINLQYCFTYYKGDIGAYMPIEEGVKANVTVFLKEGAPKGAELIDELFQTDGDQSK